MAVGVVAAQVAYSATCNNSCGSGTHCLAVDCPGSGCHAETCCPNNEKSPSSYCNGNYPFDCSVSCS